MVLMVRTAAVSATPSLLAHRSMLFHCGQAVATGEVAVQMQRHIINI